MRASPVMVERILANPKVRPQWNSVVEEVLGDDEKGMTGVRLKDVNTGETRTVEAAGMFVAIGHTPNTRFLKGQLETDAQGFIVLTDKGAHDHKRRWRIRRRRRSRPDLQAGHHRRRHGLQGGARRRALARPSSQAARQRTARLAVERRMNE